MSHRPGQISILLLAATVVASVPAFADQQCKPVVGSFEAQIVMDGSCTAPPGSHLYGRPRLGRHSRHIRVHDDEPDTER